MPATEWEKIKPENKRQVLFWMSKLDLYRKQKPHWNFRAQRHEQTVSSERRLTSSKRVTFYKKREQKTGSGCEPEQADSIYIWNWIFRNKAWTGGHGYRIVNWSHQCCAVHSASRGQQLSSGTGHQASSRQRLLTCSVGPSEAPTQQSTPQHSAPPVTTQLMLASNKSKQHMVTAVLYKARRTHSHRDEKPAQWFWCVFAVDKSATSIFCLTSTNKDAQDQQIQPLLLSLLPPLFGWTTVIRWITPM